MDVRMPDGTIISGVPEGVTQTELLERYNKYTGAAVAESQPAAPAGIESIAPKRPGILADAAQREAAKADMFGGAGTAIADLAKMIAGSTVGGTLATPSGIEQGIKGIARQSMEGEPEMVMPAGVYQPGLDTEEALFGQETAQQRAQRKLGAQRAVAELPEIPGAKTLANIGRQAQRKIESTVSEETKKALEESQVTGNIFKGEIDFGKNPSVRGYAMQAASVLGSIAPVIATAVATKSPVAGGAVGGGMAADEAGQNAAEYIRKMSDEQLAQTSPFYAQMIAGGAKPDEARALTIRKAAETGAALQGMVATLGDTFTGKLVTGAFDDILMKMAGKSALGKGVAGTALSSMEQGLGETAEGVASDIGIKTVAPTKEIGEDSAQNLIMGLLGGAGPGSVSALAGQSETKPEEPPRPKYERPAPDQGLEALARAKGFFTPEAAPGAPAAESRTAPTLTLDQETELRDLLEQTARAEGKEAPAPTEPLQQVTVPPVVEKPQPVAAAPAEPVETETPVEAEKPKAEGAMSQQLQEAKDALSKAGQGMNTARRMRRDGEITEAQFNSLQAQFDARKKRYEDLMEQEVGSKSPFYKEAMDIGKRMIATGDLKAAGFGQGIMARARLGQIDEESMNFYRERAKEYEQRSPEFAGKTTIAEQRGLPEFVATGNSKEIARYEYLKDHPEHKNTLAKASDALQAVADEANRAGFKVDDIDPTSPQYLQDIKRKASRLAGATSRYMLEAERVAKGHKTANQDKLNKALSGLEDDIAQALEPTEKPAAIAAPTKPAAKETPLRQASYAKNPFLTFLADKGLYHVKGESGSLKSEFSPDKQIMVSGHGPVFKSSGMALDEMLPVAIEYGYLTPDATEQDLYNLIQKAVSGKKVEPAYSEKGVEDVAAKYEERMAMEEEAYAERAGQSDAEWYGMSEDEYMRMMEREVADASDADFRALEETIPDLMGTPASTMSERAAMEALGFTEEEIQNEERRTAAKTGEAAPAKEAPSAEKGAPPAELELQQQTEEELKAKQAEVDRLTKENERLAKEAEAKAKADAEREEFVLTGSDRAADVAAARGQKDIFGAMEEEAPAADAALTKLQKVAESLLDSPRTKETIDEVEYEGKTYESRTRTYEGRLFGSELQLLRDTVGNANSVTLVNEPERVLTLQLTGKQVGQGRDMRITETVYTPKAESGTGQLVTFVHKTDTEPGKGQVSGYYPGTYSYETGAEVGIPAKGGKNEFTGELKESDIYTLKDADQLKREASNAGFEYRQASGNSEIRYLQSLGYKAMRRGPEIIVFDAKDANFKKATPEEKIVAEEVVGPAEKPAAPQLTREPVTIEGQFTEVGEEKQRALITDQTKKLTEAQTSTLEKFYGFARDTEEFANAVRQDVVNFITKGAAYVNGKIRAIIRSMANGVLSVAVAFNPQFVSMPYTIAVPQYETRVEQVMQEVPASVQKQMSDDAKRAYATIYPAIKDELQANDKFFIVADKQTANTFVFNPDGSPFMYSKTLFGAGIGDFIKGNNNIVSNRITPAGLFDLGLRDAKRSVDEAATAGEYDFGKVFVLDKSQKGANGLYSTTIMHSVWTKETDAKQRLAALQKPGAEDSRYSFGCINVDKETYGKLVANNLAQMDGAKIFIVPENGKDVMSFVNGEATYSTDIIRKRAEPVTKEVTQEVQRAAPTAETERTVAAKEEEGPVLNSIEANTLSISPVQEEKKRSPSFKRRMDKLNRDRLNGKISDEQFINETDWALKSAENERLSKEPAKKQRGYLEIVRRLAEATKNGDISKEAFDLATWFMRNNEALVDDLGVSIRGKGDAGVGGQYVKLARIMRLIKDGGSDLTIVHEILHHLERMMPAKVQQAIRTAWAKQLASAQKKAKTPAEQLYFKLLMDGHYGENNFDFVDVPDGEMSKVFMKALAELDFDRPGSKSSFELAETLLKMGLVPISNYQYFNPSEFWAVNGSEMVKGRFDAVQGGTLARLKNWLKELVQKVKGLLGINSKASIIGALDSLAKSDGTFVTEDMLGEGAYKSVHRNYRGDEAPSSAWTSMDDDKLDTAIYNIVDKHIDTKRVIENIQKVSGEIAEDWDAYTKEELYHGRTAKAINDFLDNEMLPITKEMKDNDVTLDELDEYLHNRHAEERNEQINRINPDPKLQDRGSGISTEDAAKYLAGLSEERAKVFEDLAAKVDAIVQKTQKILVDSGMETQETINAWNNTYEHYVPLQRDDLEYVHTGAGISGGYGTRGKTSKRATGSLKSVVDIFENIAIQRERAVMKAERARVGRALYGLAIKYPNPNFWLPINPDAIKNKADLVKELVSMGLSPADAENLFQEPTVSDIDKKTGLVKYVINQNNRFSENVFPVRINGKDRFIIFNGSDPRAERMVRAMKNLDAEQLGVVVGSIGEVTRFLASVNTQYNPVFGAWNFLRDVQGAALNLSTTDIAGHEKEVLAGISPIKGMPALRAIYRDLRGKGATTPEMQGWIDLFEQYQKAGGATGYKEQFSKGRDAPGIVERELKKLDRGNVRKAADAVFNWLSDYNDAMENAVRLSAFKVALDQGFSEDKAASIAKNLTVNFNRKGASSPTLQALYAFFNASVQGTARLAETLKGPAGRKIMAGGFMIGVAQALALAMAGFDDDDPPEFVKNKNLIIPTTGGNYLIVPMPMGFNIFPGVGRLTTEYLLGQGGMITGAKGAGDKIASAASLILDSFNPLGSGSFLQMIAPTPADPLVAIATNRDAFGRPIAKEDRATTPTPGYTRSRENASYVSKKLAEFLNYVSSPMGTKYTKGAISPTADQLDYLAGQVGGGVSRELLKTGEYLSAVAKGETSETPSYRVPIVGKMYGETETPAAISSKFYQNVTMLAEMENEIKSRQKNREDTKEYRADHPEFRLINRANYLENQITALNKQKKLLQERGAPESRIKAINEQKTRLMKGLNDQVKKLQQ